MERKGRPRRIRAWAVVLALLGGLAGGEVLVRATVPSYAPREGHPATVPTGGHPAFWLEPDTTYEYVWDGDPFGTLPEGARMTVRIGPDGYRAGGTPVEKADVVVVGDSITFGEGVEVGDRFTDAVAAGIRLPDGRAPLVVNAGVPGYALADHEAMVRAVVSRHTPRVVLVVVQPDDLATLREVRDASGGLLLSAPAEEGPSRLYAEVRRKWDLRSAAAWTLSFWNGVERQRWRASRSLFTQMKTRAEAEGGRLAVVVFPLLHRLDDYPLAPAHQLVVQACEEFDVPVLDLHRTFLAHDARDLWVHPTDHHPNARAHALAAEAITPFVESLLRE